MNKTSSKILQHSLYILFITVVLTLVFGVSWGNGITAFYFICMLLPITIGTSYFFNYVLIQKYYLKNRRLKFILYSIYTIIISLYLQSLVLMFSFVYLANFSFQNLAPNASDTILLASVLYLLVLFGSFLLMINQIRENQRQIDRLISENKKLEKSFLEVMSNRKMVKVPYGDILYIESLADYIQIHTVNETIISKEKISKISARLPQIFIRIHRSFVVNKEKVNRFSANEVEINNTRLNIGRSYKAAVKSEMQQKR